MPRDGSGIYTKPFLDVVGGTTIESAVHNGTVSDIETDLNAPRPIVAGGTGATSAAGALANLGGVAKAGDTMTGSLTISTVTPQLVLNGSVAQPVGFVGKKNNLNRWQVVAGDMSAEAGGNSGADFTIQRYTDLGSYVDDPVRIARGTGAMTVTGTFNVAALPGNSSILAINAPSAASGNHVIGAEGGVRRWMVSLGPGGATKDFAIERYDDGGTSQGFPLVIARSTGAAQFSGALTISGTSSHAGAATFNSTANITGTLSCGSAPLSAFTAAIKLGAATGVTGVLIRAQTDSSGNAIAFQNAADATVGAITTTVSATAYGTVSDDRLKEDLKSFDAGNIVDDTNVYDFAWKSTGERAYGVMAQQAKNIYPTAVIYNEETDWWGVDYSKYVPVLLQELKALRARVAELEGRLDAKPS